MKIDILLVDSAMECPCSSGFAPSLANKNYTVDRRVDEYTCVEALKDGRREYGIVIVHLRQITKSLRLVRNIRAHNKTIPIVVITFINRGPTDIKALEDAGATDYVIKPMCGHAYLIEVIKNYLPSAAGSDQ